MKNESVKSIYFLKKLKVERNYLKKRIQIIEFANDYKLGALLNLGKK